MNEHMKIYRRLRTWLMFMVLIAGTVTLLIVVHNDLTKGDWKVDLTKQITRDQQRLSRPDIPAARKAEMQQRLAVDQYRLKNNMPPTELSLWGGVLTSANLLVAITMLTVIIAGESVAGEFSSGTIKLLLIGRASRSKILLSKYITTLVFALLMLTALFGTAFVTSGILEGFDQVGLPYLYATPDLVVHESNMFTYAMSTYGYKCVEMVLLVTMAFMISTVFRSISIAIATSVGLTFGGAAIAAFFSSRQYWWAKYYLFENTDLTVYLTNSPMIDGMTRDFSVGVIVVYFVMFIAASWIVFNKRDVTA